MNFDTLTILRHAVVNVQTKDHVQDHKHGTITRAADADAFRDHLHAHKTNTTIKNLANVNAFQNAAIYTH